MSELQSNREPVIDTMKGLLIIIMIYHHAIMLLGDPSGMLHSAILSGGALACYPGFLFCFGYACYVAYLRDPDKIPYRRMLFTALRIYGAFVISSIFWQFLVEKRGLDILSIAQFFLLLNVTPYSEFLIAFSLTILVACILPRPLCRIISDSRLFLIVFGVLLTTTWIPYRHVRTLELGLLIGTEQYSLFPIVQYFPLFLMGMYMAKHGLSSRMSLCICGLVLSTLVSIGQLETWLLVSRFPPSFSWIVVSLFAAYLALFISDLIQRIPTLGRIMESLGQNILFYFLGSNILIFALRHHFVTDKANHLQCLSIVVLLMITLWYLTTVIRIPLSGRQGM